MQTNLFTTTQRQFPKQSSLVNLERISSDEIEGIEISYSQHQTIYGDATIASTAKGVCFLTFENNEEALKGLRKEFVSANLIYEVKDQHQQALNIFSLKWESLDILKLHVKATDFQLKVWGELLEIPIGSTSNYGILADKLNIPNGARAVGTAIGSNPVAFLIPCHRVVQSTGGLGGFRWGLELKRKWLVWEEESIRSDFS